MGAVFLGVLGVSSVADAKPKLSKKTLEVLAAYPDHLAAAQKIEAEDPDRLKAEFVGKEQCFWEMDKFYSSLLADNEIAASKRIEAFKKGRWCPAWVATTAVEAARSRWDGSACVVPKLEFDEQSFANPQLAAEAWGPASDAYSKALNAAYEACAKSVNAQNHLVKNYVSHPYNRGLDLYCRAKLRGSLKHEMASDRSNERWKNCAVVDASAPFRTALASFQERGKAITVAGVNAHRAREKQIKEWRDKLSQFRKECDYDDDCRDEAKTRERLVNHQTSFFHDGATVEKALAGCTSFIAALEADDVPAYVKQSMADDLAKAKVMAAVVTKDKAILIKKADTYRTKIGAVEASCKGIGLRRNEMEVWVQCLDTADQKWSKSHSPAQLSVMAEDVFIRYFEPKIVSCAKRSGVYRKIAKGVENRLKWDVECPDYDDYGDVVTDPYHGPSNTSFDIINHIVSIEEERYEDE